VIEGKNDAGAAKWVNVADSYTPNGLHLFRVTWSAAKVELRIDGVTRGTITSPNLPTSFGTNATIGHRGTTLGHYLNTAHDDLRVSSIARSDEQDLVAYQSNLPLPVDDDTVLKLPFDDSLTPTPYVGLIENLGNVECYPIIEIGASTNPSVTFGSVILSWTGTVELGETLIIDCDKKTVKKGATNCLKDYTGGFPSCPVGNTKFAGTNATVKWRNRHV
jgi:hypothetical protein